MLKKHTRTNDDQADVHWQSAVPEKLVSKTRESGADQPNLNSRILLNFGLASIRIVRACASTHVTQLQKAVRLQDESGGANRRADSAPKACRAVAISTH